MTTLHIALNSDRVHFCEHDSPSVTYLFSEFDSKDEAIEWAKRDLWKRAEYLEKLGEKVKVLFRPVSK